MDLSTMSIGMHQASLQNAVSISVMKMVMNSRTEIATQMTEMMSNMAVDTSKGINIDVRV
ncbi:putative motility protein [Clostridium chromiireducens]|uniref:Putative motility protein n=1 Tax=Clostridium chromiireducens TaxID=225345 RepID=A0A399IUN3_9CLOT|nr:YjfB family protein [Clostridium chromiireducens]RII36187.1 putative motility protein [Clostridium chromiireducens]